MWYNEHWQSDISTVDVVDKSWKDIVWVKENDVRNLAISYLNNEEIRKLPPHEFNGLVFKIKEYLKHVDNDRSEIEKKFEWLRRWTVAECRASATTVRREIDSRRIEEISQIRTPWDLSRYIETSWDKSMKILKEELGTENILSMIWLWLCYGTIEIWSWFADILKFWEELGKMIDDLKHWDLIMKDKINMVVKTLWIEWLRLLCLIPFGRIILRKLKSVIKGIRSMELWELVWNERGWFLKWSKKTEKVGINWESSKKLLSENEKKALVWNELLDKFKDVTDFWEKVLWKKWKLSFNEKSVIIKAHEIWMPVDWKYSHSDVSLKYRTLRETFGKNEAKKLLKSWVCWKIEARAFLDLLPKEEILRLEKNWFDFWKHLEKIESMLDIEWIRDVNEINRSYLLKECKELIWLKKKEILWGSVMPSEKALRMNDLLNKLWVKPNETSKVTEEYLQNRVKIDKEARIMWDMYVKLNESKKSVEYLADYININGVNNETILVINSSLEKLNPTLTKFMSAIKNNQLDSWTSWLKDLKESLKTVDSILGRTESGIKPLLKNKYNYLRIKLWDNLNSFITNYK